jgi:hypothetical protein
LRCSGSKRIGGECGLPPLVLSSSLVNFRAREGRLPPRWTNRLGWLWTDLLARRSRCQLRAHVSQLFYLAKSMYYTSPFNWKRLSVITVS